jgi:CHRD domain
MRMTIFGVMTAALLAAAPLAQAQTMTLKAQLSGGNEVVGVSTGAHGSATVTLNRATGEITWVVDVYNLPTGLVGAHIHVAADRTNGPVIVNFPITNGISGDFRIEGRSTTFNANAALGINSADDLLFAIASGNSYVNVHSQTNPGGEIRGQLCPTSASANVFNGIALCTIP